MASNPNLGHGLSSGEHYHTDTEHEKGTTGRVDETHIQVGLLWVESRLKSSSTATLDEFHHFYSDELIPTVLKGPYFNGPKSCVRYKNETVSASDKSPFSTLWPLPDLQLLHGPLRDRYLSATRGVPTKAFHGDTALQHIDYNNLSYRYLHTLASEHVQCAELEHVDAYPLTMIADSFEGPNEQKLGIREEIQFKA